MRKPNKNSGLYQYLIQTGVLENGTEDEIKQAKRNYWQRRDKEYKTQKRREQRREVVMSFPADEINNIRYTAKAKGHTIHDYIRACVKADMSQLTIIPHRALVAEIMQVMLQCHNQLEAIKKKEGKGWLVISRTYENVENTLNQTENRINEILKRPVSLKETIADSIKRNPATLELLKSILTTHGN